MSMDLLQDETVEWPSWPWSRKLRFDLIPQFDPFTPKALPQ
jgi:hypothetical protein